MLMGKELGWPIPEYWVATPSFVHWVDAFSTEELDLLQNKAKEGYSPATVGQGEENGKIRRTDITWLCGDEFAWVYERVALVVAKVNFQYYRYNLSTIAGRMQLANYKAKNKGKYDWHLDTGLESMRKLSFILQLSDPEEYKGGEVQIKVGPEAENPLPNSRGDMIIFPSHTLHRVKPVTAGERQSLVAWVTGPGLM